jgi:ubiquinone/menaquinone biosynthesis C-methylase UbiE
MQDTLRPNRWSQLLAWIVFSLFILGYFFSRIGTWTGPIMGVWFAGTQKPRRGFLWMLGFSFIPSLIFGWRKFPLSGPGPAFQYLGMTLLVSVLGILPFTFHRLVSPRLPGLLSTLPFPFAVVAFKLLISPSLHTGEALPAAIPLFLISWFAATLIWIWNREFKTATIALAALPFAAAYALAAYGFFHRLNVAFLPASLPIAAALAWMCVAGAIALSIFAILKPGKRLTWASRPQTVASLQSPATGNPLHVVTENGRETLLSTSGERFPIRHGIPSFLTPEDLTGDNGKYRHLYETIGGFYDDTQRVFVALKGFNRDAYFRSYMSLLEAKPGDSVLETSVGTGLNFKYLPRGVKLSGLDLSPEMLANCQANLRRWQMDADLYLGNAESLPFTDSSFDVVFHVGGINFFNDRARAIREMIRVAKPGSLMLIADETEKHVKQVYEKGLGPLYKDRKQPVSAPIDLVPPEMQETHLEIGRSGEWYMLTFRKPAVGLKLVVGLE